MTEFETKCAVRDRPCDRVYREEHDAAELVLFSEELSGSIEDYDVVREDMGENLEPVGDDLQHWVYVTRFTLTPKVKVAG